MTAAGLLVMLLMLALLPGKVPHPRERPSPRNVRVHPLGEQFRQFTDVVCDPGFHRGVTPKSRAAQRHCRSRPGRTCCLPSSHQRRNSCGTPAKWDRRSLARRQIFKSIELQRRAPWKRKIIARIHLPVARDGVAKSIRLRIQVGRVRPSRGVFAIDRPWRTSSRAKVAFELQD